MALAENDNGASTFYQWLHWLYGAMANGSRAIRFRLTALAWSTAIGFTLLILVSGLGVFLSVVIILSLIAFLWVIAFLHLWFVRYDIKLVRNMPRSGSVGQQLRYEVVLTGSGRRPINLFLLEKAPDVHPRIADFYESREPGEEERNLFDRSFAYYRWLWLVNKSRYFYDEPSAMVCLKHKQPYKMSCELLPLRRGVLVLNEAHAILPEPLGLFQRYRKMIQSEDRVVILPKRYAIPNLSIAGCSRNQFGGEATSRLSGQTGEFVSLRDYRPGDSKRMIHWKSWAKTGSPMVREVEEEFFPRYGLILDTGVRAGLDHLFEIGVSVAASFACAIDTKESLLDLMFLQQGLEIHTVGKNSGSHQAMLEVLAGVQRQPEVNWQALKKAVLAQSDELSACILVLADWSDTRRQLIKAWLASGLELIVLFVADSKEHARASIAEQGVACPVVIIGAKSVERDLRQLTSF